MELDSGDLWKEAKWVEERRDFAEEEAMGDEFGAVNDGVEGLLKWKETRRSVDVGRRRGELKIVGNGFKVGNFGE